MRHSKSTLASIASATFLSFVATTIATAEVDSGPKVGTNVSPLKVFAVTGDNAGKELDYAAARGEKPTVYIFMPHERFDRPLARLLKVLEKGVAEAGKDCGIVTVFLTNDEAKTKEHLPKVQMSLQFTHNHLALFPSTTIGPDGWAINPDAQLTVVIVNKGSVTATFAYRSANETVASEILAALRK